MQDDKPDLPIRHDEEQDYLRGGIAALAVVMSLAIRLQMSVTSAERDAIIRNLRYLRSHLGESTVGERSVPYQSGFEACIDQVEKYLVIDLPSDV